jgi:hypothetical protein
MKVPEQQHSAHRGTPALWRWATPGTVPAGAAKGVDPCPPVGPALPDTEDCESDGQSTSASKSTSKPSWAALVTEAGPEAEAGRQPHRRKERGQSHKHTHSRITCLSGVYHHNPARTRVHPVPLQPVTLSFATPSMAGRASAFASPGRAQAWIHRYPISGQENNPKQPQANDSVLSGRAYLWPSRQEQR